MAVTIEAKNLQELKSAASQFLNQFSEAKTIAFYGNMGAGKTTFIKALCQILGVTDTVNSPTFSIVNEYLSNKNNPVYHFDLYRLEDQSELLSIGFEDYLESGCWCFIEWPQLAEDYFDDKIVKAELIKNDDDILQIHLF